MFLNSLDKKPLFIKSDGHTIRDLTSSMFTEKTRTYHSYNLFKVPRDYVMRPDLISAAVYNNSMYAEIILKYNGISNPFSISEGDIILVPNLESAQLNVNTQEGTDVDGSKTIRDSYKYIDPTKIPKDGTSEFESRQLVKETQEGALPPNIAEEGETQIVYRNGRVYFGASVATCLKNGMSSSEYLTNAIKSI
jgi:hypothetical protein